VACVVLAAGLLAVEGAARELRSDPSTGRIRVLYMGDALIAGPFPYMMMEPGMTATPVTYVGTDQIKRQVRRYMPRTAGRLKSDYDVLILSDAFREMFRSIEINWMSEAVAEAGLGLIMVGGAHSFEGRGTVNPSWSMTTVAQVLPVEMIDYQYAGDSMRMTIVDPEAELARTLPWATLGVYGVFSEGHRVGLKQSSHLVSELDNYSYGKLPHIVWGDVGEGRGFAMTTDWTPAAGAIFMKWKYYPDFCVNVGMFTAGKKLPEDVDIMYVLRHRIRNYLDIRSTLNTVIDIVDSFGGNMAAVEQGAAVCEEAKAAADRFYALGEYVDALEAYTSAISLVNAQVEEARVAARRALFYVYLIEWAVVTGTFMITGVVIYTLMIRRKMYTEVGTTRLLRTDE
jgi:uncharacterized membrane protein